MKTLLRLVLAGAATAATIGPVAGCGSSDVALEPAPAVDIPQAKPTPEAKSPAEGPPKGSTLGAPTNPGGAD
ncbi:MAG TPA: hypothetical protein VG406_16110 [Isosphaeraceae bacterium]|nr:hypothetical protein [Isosphaeraceae bacterium]